VGKNFLKKVFPHTPFQKLLYWEGMTKSGADRKKNSEKILKKF